MDFQLAVVEADGKQRIIDDSDKIDVREFKTFVATAYDDNSQRGRPTMKPEVEQAVEELQHCFSDAKVVAHAKDDGGGVVTIDPVDFGPGYTPQQTWIKFAISFQYPYADIYPLFVCPDLARADGQSLGEGITKASFEGEPALQLSRRSNRLDPETETAALKVTKVIQWLREQ